jgi:hypothetical protein
VPLTDDTDFKTLETAVAYNAGGMALYWHFVTSGGAYTATAVTPTTSGSYDWAHQQQGMYTIEIPASGGASINNDTEGYGYFTGFATGVLPWRGPTIGFRAAALNDALTDGGDNLDVNVTQFGGTNATTSGGRPEVNTTHAAGTAWGSGAITAASIAADAITAAKIADGAIDAATFAASAITSTVLAADAITAAKVAADVGTEIGTAVWATTTRQLTGTQTFNVTGDITGNLSGSVGSVTGAVGSVTGNVGGNVTGSVGSLAAQAKADVNAEVVDGISVDTYAEPGQGAPPATASIATKVGYTYKAWRNKTTQTATTYSLYADDTTTVDQKATVSDDATTYTRTEVATGP